MKNDQKRKKQLLCDIFDDFHPLCSLLANLLSGLITGISWMVCWPRFFEVFFLSDSNNQKDWLFTCQTIVVSYLTSVPFLVYLGFFQAIIFQLKKESVVYSRETSLEAQIQITTKNMAPLKKAKHVTLKCLVS